MTVLASPRRACAPLRTRGVYVRSHNSTQTTAATPLPGANRVIEQKRRRQTPSKPSHRMRTDMTIPASAGSAKHPSGADTLPLETPLGSHPLARIEAALRADLSPKAFKLHAAVALMMREGQRFSIDDMASMSGFTGYQCRPLAAEIVAAGLFVKRRQVVRLRDGGVRDGFRYALAVTA